MGLLYMFTIQNALAVECGCLPVCSNVHSVTFLRSHYISDLLASPRISIVPNDPPRHDLNLVSLYLHCDVATQFPYLMTIPFETSCSLSRYHVYLGRRGIRQT